MPNHVIKIHLQLAVYGFVQLRNTLYRRGQHPNLSKNHSHHRVEFSPNKIGNRTQDIRVFWVFFAFLWFEESKSEMMRVPFNFKTKSRC